MVHAAALVLIGVVVGIIVGVIGAVFLDVANWDD